MVSLPDPSLRSSYQGMEQHQRHHRLCVLRRTREKTLACPPETLRQQQQPGDVNDQSAAESSWPGRHAPLAEEDEGEMVVAPRWNLRIPRETECQLRCWAPCEAGEHPLATGEVICHCCGREGYIACGCCSGRVHRGRSAGIISFGPRPF
ncbi:unnamed protein product [Lampetra planeri]